MAANTALMRVPWRRPGAGTDMQGAQAAEIMAALGHKDMTTSQRYVHWAKDQRQALAERAASTITGVLTGGKAEKKGKAA